MSCGVGCRRGSDPALLWLWCRPAATAPIRPLAWEPPYAEGAALEKAKRQKKKPQKPQKNKKEDWACGGWMRTRSTLSGKIPKYFKAEIKLHENGQV